MIKSQRANYNVKNTGYNAKIFEIENKILSITGLAPTSAPTAKMLDIKSKYFTTGDYNKFTSQTFDAEIKQERLVDESSIAGFINNSDLDKKVAKLATKTKLKAEQNKITKYKHLIQVILLKKVILKKMKPKII